MPLSQERYSERNQLSYRFVEGLTQADVAFEASGKTLEELFESAANAFTESIVRDLGTIENKKSVKLDMQAENEERLLHDFLEELVYFKDADRIVFCKYELKISKDKGMFLLDAVLFGETIDPEKHPIIVDVKAVSWHKFRLEKSASGWKSQVILDV